MRAANLRGATLSKADLTGAKVAGLIGTGSPLADVLVSWLDTSEAGDGTGRITNGEIPGLLTRPARSGRRDAPASRRYFGQGDVLQERDARLRAGRAGRDRQPVRELRHQPGRGDGAGGG